MHRTVIDKFYDDNKVLLDNLVQVDPSSHTIAQDNFRKILILAIASYFEDTIKNMLIDLFNEQTSKHLAEFVRNKAIERQYHTYFSWDSNNANQFFGLFGNEFKRFMQTNVKSDEALDEAIKAFLRLGQLRNQLVHQNFATFALSETVDEIHKLYTTARTFVDTFPNKLQEYIDSILADI